MFIWEDLTEQSSRYVNIDYDISIVQLGTFSFNDSYIIPQSKYVGKAFMNHFSAENQKIRIKIKIKCELKDDLKLSLITPSNNKYLIYHSKNMRNFYNLHTYIEENSENTNYISGDLNTWTEINSYSPECGTLDSDIIYELSGTWSLEINNKGSTLGIIEDLSIEFVPL